MLAAMYVFCFLIWRIELRVFVYPLYKLVYNLIRKG